MSLQKCKWTWELKNANKTRIKMQNKRIIKMQSKMRIIMQIKGIWKCEQNEFLKCAQNERFWECNAYEYNDMNACDASMNVKTAKMTWLGVKQVHWEQTDGYN